MPRAAGALNRGWGVVTLTAAREML